MDSTGAKEAAGSKPASSADEMLEQLAGDEIDRLLAEAEADAKSSPGVVAPAPVAIPAAPELMSQPATIAEIHSHAQNTDDILKEAQAVNDAEIGDAPNNEPARAASESATAPNPQVAEAINPEDQPETDARPGVGEALAATADTPVTEEGRAIAAESDPIAPRAAEAHSDEISNEGHDAIVGSDRGQNTDAVATADAPQSDPVPTENLAADSSIEMSASLDDLLSADADAKAGEEKNKTPGDSANLAAAASTTTSTASKSPGADGSSATKDAATAKTASVLHAADVDLEKDSRPPAFHARIVNFLVAPLEAIPDALRDAIGKVAVVTLFNALGLFAWVYISHHRHPKVTAIKPPAEQVHHASAASDHNAERSASDARTQKHD